MFAEVCLNANIRGAALGSGNLVVRCDTVYSCGYAEILCPKGSGSCDVSCLSPYSCNPISIEWTEGNSGQLECGSQTIWDCEQFLAYPPPISANASLIVHCDDPYECDGLVFTCPRDAECNIFCEDLYSCYRAIIWCPESAVCTTFTFLESCKKTNFSTFTALQHCMYWVIFLFGNRGLLVEIWSFV